jgi:replicative DNA helicase
MNRHESWTTTTAKSAQPVSAVANLDIEQGILGAVLLGNPGVSCVHWVEKLLPEDFSNELHARIFDAIKSAVARGQTPTPLLLKSQFEGEAAGEISVPAYLGRLAANAASPLSLGSYVKALREMRARRDLLAIGEHAGLLASNPSSDLPEGAAQLVGALDNLRTMLRDRRPSMSSMEDASTATIAALRQPKESIRTGLVSLDDVLGGWHRKEFSVVAARPSMGKSAFLFSTLLQAAKRGTTSLIFSLEMPTEATTTRMLSDLVWNTQTPIPYVDIMRGKIQPYELDRIVAAAAKCRQLPIYIDDQAGLTASEIRSRAKRMIENLDRQGRRVDVIAIDHLGKVRASERYAGNKVHETGEKSAAFAEMAKELDVAVVAAHQLNRAVEGRENKRPGLSDLRDSGDIEQDAETVMFLYRPAYYLERAREDGVGKEDERKAKLTDCLNTLEVIIAKNRNGPCCTLDFFVDMPSNVIRDMSKREPA